MKTYDASIHIAVSIHQVTVAGNVPLDIFVFTTADMSVASPIFLNLDCRSSDHQDGSVLAPAVILN